MSRPLAPIFAPPGLFSSSPVQCGACGKLGAHGGEECPLLVKEHEQRLRIAEDEHKARVKRITYGPSSDWSGAE